MIEEEWLTCGDPIPMLNSLERATSKRKLRLFACACCYRILPHLRLAESRTALKMNEQYADGEVPLTDLLSVARLHRNVVGSNRFTAVGAVECAVGLDYTYGQLLPALVCAIGAASNAAWVAAGVLEDKGQRPTAKERAQKSREDAVQTEFVRDIFGNSFEPIIFSPSWRTSTAVALASQMYKARDFSAMPILADALQDAGCDRADMLDHCRGPGPHVRGCWVADLVLRKK
ncbi:hypothetical protein VT84_23970 [Gemmata sp. SH-PL17]|uniref:hypothetical protein n=1 Tax=Gemmata sp. SH-PL17 TaxID=1630693 RepID=UPI00078B2769|nr:hypothetical protein [Gemmata sp. SH-PL17]AMV27479.1 hypothetical protein VT84_23970 [Gemmata sp. SH-PL17]